jgi:hypothetical protein
MDNFVAFLKENQSKIQVFAKKVWKTLKKLLLLQKQVK